ncbi:putative toxin-antitoxin system toxin component, PIN family [Candidatus Micrarchaeota archaeon]|nr:putative toxin-antitoxin system toxin component, PIN family [Candidatus Micrarchaeota archaeon]MBI5177078.1 putative toxin-antitoxin system toxin component, PIN family [Candidatus Micrarchaeota archaeon]
MKVILDTNVIVSGTFWAGASFRVLQLVDKGKLKLFISPSILKEYLKVLQDGEILGKTSGEQYDAGLAAVHKLLLNATIVEPKVRVKVVKEDPDDDKVLDAALAAKAQCIITQDRHLLKFKAFEGIPILTPEQFLAGNKL